MRSNGARNVGTDSLDGGDRLPRHVGGPRRRPATRMDAEPEVRGRSALWSFSATTASTLEMKCLGQTRNIARRSVWPSTMSLLGLIRHMAEVERAWFPESLAGRDAPKLYCTEDDRDGDWNGALPDRSVVGEAWEAWRGRSSCRPLVDNAANLGGGRERRNEHITLRWVLIHLIEMARHCGHADLLRRRMDGRVGRSSRPMRRLDDSLAKSAVVQLRRSATVRTRVSCQSPRAIAGLPEAVQAEPREGDGVVPTSASLTDVIGGAEDFTASRVELVETSCVRAFTNGHGKPDVASESDS